MRKLLSLAPLILLGVIACGEKETVGDHPTAINARRGTDPEFAEKRAKHQMSPPPNAEGESNRL